ncbi:MAG: phosphoribosylanthranilate isomerase [Acidobacteriota bacterium]
MMNVQVKVCGVTTVGDARLAVELGAAYLGLNFYPGSPRCVSVERAREIADAVEGRARLVGVFVNAPASQVEEIAGALGLDLLQFHGDESPEWIAPFAGRAIKAFRGVPVRETERFPEVWGFLVDAPAVAPAVGGTGQPWDYSALKPFAAAAAGRPVFLAGGISPDNVRAAVDQSGALLIDVCSRVERSPGVKDPDLLSRLFSEIASHEETHVP